jgi:hypothetical protein
MQLFTLLVPLLRHAECSCLSSSTIIEDLYSHIRHTPRKALTYFYIQYSATSTRTPETLVKSIVVQLFNQQTSLAHPSPSSQPAKQSLETIFEKHQNGSNQASSAELIDLLPFSFAKFSTTYLIIDALGECSEVDVLFTQFLHKMRIEAGGKLNILVTSRETREINEQMNGHKVFKLCLQNSLIHDDINAYLYSQIYEGKKFEKWNEKVKEEVYESLQNGSKGMLV